MQRARLQVAPLAQALACCAVLILAAWLWSHPIRDSASRLLLVANGLACWTLLAIAARRRWLRAVVLLVPLGLCLPGRAIDPSALRGEYVRCLARYEQTPFVWGGETERGLDCSGLVRRAMIDALWRHGLRRANPRAVRAGLWLWWHDTSAQALGQGYRGLTRDVGGAPSVNAADHTSLLPGDLAVLDGTHVMAYLGRQTWIEADPSPAYGDRVVCQTVPTTNPWFGKPAQLRRWVWLAG